MKVVVVIPAYNEQETVGQAVRAIREYADEVIVVDDGSSDQTAARAASAGADVLKHIINRGQGAALRTGIRAALAADAEIVVTFDADLQQDPSEIPAVAAPVLDNSAEVSLGSRFLGRAVKMPVSRRILLKAALIFTRLATGLKVTDTHNGFRAFSRSAAEKIKISQNGFAHASEILADVSRLGLSYKEVPVNINYSRYSLKKGQKLSGSLRIILDLLKGDILR